MTAHILCVDDDAAALALRSRLLSLAGYQVSTATDSASALHILREKPVQLLITEYEVAGEAWEELAEAIKVENPDVLVLVYTAKMELPEKLPYADLVLGKGMVPAEFLEQVASLMGRTQD